MPRKSPFTNVTAALFMATSVPVPIVTKVSGNTFDATVATTLYRYAAPVQDRLASTYWGAHSAQTLTSRITE